MTYLAHIGEQNLDIWSKNMLRNTDMEHLKGTENQGVIWACLITRKGTRQVMGTGMGSEANEHTWRLPRDR